MFTFLLAVIFMSFISLGLPDSLLGAAWPVMYTDLGASLSWAGGISMIISAGTIVSSLASDRLNSRLGTGKITAVSVGMTAAALFGFSISHSYLELCLWAIPYGLGAGSVDAALNNYVALHYSSRIMSWLHCMWGIGASTGPVIMAWALTNASWNTGYRIISLIQIALTLVIISSLKQWLRPGEGEGEEEIIPVHKSMKELLAMPGVKEVLICFFCYCAVETTAGMWAASYCTLARGIDAETAANWASLFYLGITIGRFFNGFLAGKYTDRQLIRAGQMISLAGVIFVLLPFGNTLLFPGLILTGIGCAPVYPCIIHETPENFGREVSMAMTGIQMACAYVGTLAMPPLFGLIAEHINVGLYPYYLLVILLIELMMAEKLHRRTAKH